MEYATAPIRVVHLESAIMSSTMSSSGCSGTSSHAQKDTFLSVYGCELATPDADRICCLSAPRMATHDSGICRYRRCRLCCSWSMLYQLNLCDESQLAPHPRL